MDTDRDWEKCGCSWFLQGNTSERPGTEFLRGRLIIVSNLVFNLFYLVPFKGFITVLFCIFLLLFETGALVSLLSFCGNDSVSILPKKDTS